MPTPRSMTKTDLTRVFCMEDGAGPAVAPEYMGVWKAGSSSKDYGVAEAIEIPSDAQYGHFDEIDSLPGAESKPTMDFTARYARTLSDMMRLADRECEHDFQIHIGECGDLQDFTGGWDKIFVMEHARISSHSIDELGALSSDERAAVNESITVQGRKRYEIKTLEFAEICGVVVIQEVVAVTFCDTKACGECGEISDGCQKLFALILSVGGSPGLGAQVVYSDDQGATCGATPITTLPANQDPNDMACMGDDIVVVSEDSESHHYADRDEILLGIETWLEQATGYVAGNGPLCIWALKPNYAWIGAENGYVYFLDNPANPVTVQDAGVATIANLNDCHAYDEENVLMVGDNNAVIHTTDGSTWTAVVGPEVGVNLNCCWMSTKYIWWVGSASGRLWYTLNSGATWVEKLFPGAQAGQVRDIYFATKQVGYLAHDTATPAGRILRTIDGGYQWYVLPEGVGTITANDRINNVTTCDDPNLVVGGGLADNAADGILVKAA